MLALHQHNEDAQAAQLVARLLAGESLALVSDAGTPLVSDPGFRLVRAARAAGVRVSPVPGACAAIAAFSVAGLPSDRFVFEGFLPAKAAARRERLSRLRAETRTLMFYESAHRIEEALADMAAVFGANAPRRDGARTDQVVRNRARWTALAELHARVSTDADQRKGEFVRDRRGRRRRRRRRRSPKASGCTRNSAST